MEYMQNEINTNRQEDITQNKKTNNTNVQSSDSSESISPDSSESISHIYVNAPGVKERTSDVSLTNIKNNALLLPSATTDLASLKGNVSVLSNHGIPVSGEASEATKLAFMQAAKNGNAEELTALLDRVNINTVDSYGMTALMYAVLSGSIETVKILINKGADVNVRNSEKMTALMFAASGGSEDIVKELLKAGAKVNEWDSAGKTVLMYAADRGTTQVLKVLIGQGARVDSVTNKGWTALIYAANRGGSKELLEALIENGAKVDHLDLDERTALMYAAAGGSEETLKALIQHGASVNLIDYQGQTALMFAAASGSKESLEVLIEAGATVDDVSNEGNTSLVYALAFHGTQFEGVTSLLDAEADQDYAKKNMAAKRVAHALGVKGVSSIPHKSGISHDCPLEGMFGHQAVRMVSESITPFFQTDKFAQKHISPQGRQEIEECIATAYPLKKIDIPETLQKIQAKKPVMLLGGTENHAIAMVIHEKHLFICNRGDGRQENTTQRFLIPSGVDDKKFNRKIFRHG